MEGKCFRESHTKLKDEKEIVHLSNSEDPTSSRTVMKGTGAWHKFGDLGGARSGQPTTQKAFK